MMFERFKVEGRRYMSWSVEDIAERGTHLQAAMVDVALLGDHC
jgi:hypothetical protein